MQSADTSPEDPRWWFAEVQPSGAHFFRGGGALVEIKGTQIPHNFTSTSDKYAQNSSLLRSKRQGVRVLGGFPSLSPLNPLDTSLAIEQSLGCIVRRARDHSRPSAD